MNSEFTSCTSTGVAGGAIRAEGTTTSLDDVSFSNSGGSDVRIDDNAQLTCASTCEDVSDGCLHVVAAEVVIESGAAIDDCFSYCRRCSECETGFKSYTKTLSSKFPKSR